MHFSNSWIVSSLMLPQIQRSQSTPDILHKDRAADIRTAEFCCCCLLRQGVTTVAVWSDTRFWLWLRDRSVWSGILH